MKNLFAICCLLVSFIGWSQPILESENRVFNASVQEHTGVKQATYLYFDSSFVDSSSTIKIDVLPELLAAYQSNQFQIRTGISTLLRAQLHPTLRIFADYKVGYSNADLVRYSGRLQPKSFFTNTRSNGDYVYHDLRGRISYTPNSIIQLQTGLDHIVIGEGDRSLFMGNHGVPNPFVSLRAKFWKLEYHFIQQLWKENIINKNAPKLNASHYLSFKPTKKWSFGIFETVVYDTKDTLYNRGFEVEYLNPLIFYRPQEYSLGSTDNVLLGANASFQWKKKMIYMQFILDDFVLGEIRARSRWWANKYAFQFGFKGTTQFKSASIFHRTELNIVRPFTYTQVTPGSVYGNVGLPVAHPLGANFVELYHEFVAEKDNWVAQLWLQAYLKGNDSVSSVFTYGGELYEPYNNRPTNVEYGYTIGGGETFRALQLGIQLARKMGKGTSQLFIEPRGIVSNTEGIVRGNFFLTAGFQRTLGADRRNY